ncbi:acyltransferase family protein [Thermomonas sp.]|uniref:acyltransferase family protein n=1 Tax=Thermomonas sp. TaxID=1971895 RepID=UPI003D09F7F9
MSTAYKPEIDGLRAIAVLAVVGFHAGFGPPAGFVGVDVFFVISGYLITRMLRQEVLAHQRIDIIDFYARRARRILPALLVVTVATLLASAALLPPAELRQTVQAGAAAFAFAANVFFATAANGYFDPEAHANPLLHLWSIGVEEQFYLAWPLVVLLARRRPALVFGLIAAASFAAAEWLLAHGQDRAAFYQAPMRAWELAAGGLVAVNRIPARPWVAPLGIVMVLVACLVPLARFPGTGALLPVVGAGMVIAGVHSGQRNALLASRPLVLIGLVSYSLYLWHWPIMVLGKAMPVWLQVAAALAAAAASYRWIEQPLRRRLVRPARTTVVAAAGCIAVACASTLALAKSIPAVDPPEDVIADLARLYPIGGMGCDDWYRSAQVKPCVFGDHHATRTAVIIGDSVALQWFPAVRRIYAQHGWRLVVLTKSSCPMVNADWFYDRIGGIYAKCNEWRAGAVRWIDETKPDVVILGSANDYGFSKETWISGTRDVLARIAGKSKQVVLVRSTPLLTAGGQDAFPQVHQWESEAARPIHNVVTIDMNPIVCPHGVCATQKNGVIRFRDSRHIAASFADSLAPALRRELQQGKIAGSD